jgi:hypothetical protein
MRVLLALLLLLPACLFSQYKVTVILDSIPASTNSSIFIAGNFNNWEPADPNTALVKNATGKFEKVFDDVQGATYEFKFTLGSNETMECKPDGSDIANRTLVLTSDTVIHLTVAAWKPVKKSASLAPAAAPSVNALPYLAVAIIQPIYSLAMTYGKVHYHYIKI